MNEPHPDDTELDERERIQREDFFSDEPLVCPLDKEDGEPCESCQ